MDDTVYTVGHSTHSAARFLDLLRQRDITAIGNVRSNPYSRFNPQFNREALEETLRDAAIRYIFLGKELGARSDDASCYQDGKVQYGRIARTELFRQGVEQVLDGIRKGLRVALMCAEADPIECHRTILVGRHLAALAIQVQHIHADGSVECHSAALDRLADKLRLPERDLFRTREDVLEDAYRLQGDRIAYAQVGASAKTAAG